jgi:type I restriction enzyme S subunit
VSDGPWELPADWRWVTLGEVARIYRDIVQAPDMSGSELYLGLDCIESGGRIIRWTTTGTEQVKSSKFRFNSNHILMGKLRPYLGKISLPNNSGLCSTDIIPIEAGPKISKEYLAHWLRTDYTIQASNKVASGANLPRISPKSITSLAVPLPPLSEQRRIARVLEETRNNISLRETQRDTTYTIEDASFRKIFGDPIKWGSCRDMVTIGSLATEVKYGTSKKSGPEGKYPILRMGNVTDNGEIDTSDLKYTDLDNTEIDRYTIHYGDLLFNRTNSLDKVGKAAVYTGSETLGYAGYLVRVRFEREGIANFISSYLRTDHGKATRRKLAKNSVNQANISAKELQKIRVADPTDEQINSFQEILSTTRYIRIKINAALEKEREIFRSLQHLAFRGEL